MVNPWAEGPNTPFWRTEYWSERGDGVQRKYQFCSHSNTMYGHLDNFKRWPDIPEDAVVIQTGMVWNRRGQLVWPAER